MPKLLELFCHDVLVAALSDILGQFYIAKTFFRKPSADKAVADIKYMITNVEFDWIHALFTKRER